MSAACSHLDAARLHKLYRSHVGKGPIDLARLVRVIRRETRAAEQGRIKVSRGLLRKLRSERAEVGRLAKKCAWVQGMHA